MTDFIGYAASFFVVLSFLIKNNLTYIRMTNLVGCILFVIYGAFIKSSPVMLPNSFLIVVQIVYLFRAWREKKETTTL